MRGSRDSPSSSGLLSVMPLSVHASSSAVEGDGMKCATPISVIAAIPSLTCASLCIEQVMDISSPYPIVAELSSGPIVAEHCSSL